MRVSESMEAWSASSYGGLIQYPSQDTLLQLRKYWSFYAETKNRSNAETEAFELRNRKAISGLYDQHPGKSGLVAHGARSAGALSSHATTTMGSAFKGFWKTGVAGGNRNDVRALGNDGKGWVNPMFAISSAPTGEFALHYGSDPLLGFHIGEAFSDDLTEDARVVQVVRLAKDQFRSWCGGFTSHVKHNRVQIRFFCGEAVRLCHELLSYRGHFPHLAKLTRLYSGPWTAQPLALDGLTGSSQLNYFDVIDTSNLVDHAGILNVLPAATPLLSRKGSSVLYTESLLQASDDVTMSLRRMLCSDVTTFSLMTGLAPAGHLLGFSTEPVSVEAMLMFAVQPKAVLKQYRMRVPWKASNLGDAQASIALKTSNPSHFGVYDPEQLADCFFSIYLQIFRHENVGDMMSGMNSILRQMTSPLATDLRYYTRLSFIVLLHLAKTNIYTDWPKCINHLITKIETDRSLLVGSNSLQELYLHLRLFGLWEDYLGQCIDDAEKNRLPEQIVQHQMMTPYGRIRSASGEKGPLAKTELPPTVFVTLIVPRKKLQVFTGESPDVIGTPGLHLSVTQEDPNVGFENSFFAIQCFFGKIIGNPYMGSDDFCEVEEDGLGWRGSADLVVTCPVSTSMLLLGPRDGIRVALKVNTCPSTIQFNIKLGLHMNVFKCGLDDEKHLWITKGPPGIRRWELQPDTPQEPMPSGATNSIAHINLDKSCKATNARIRYNLSNDLEESKALADGAKVTVTSSSPCTLLLKVEGSAAHRLVYPFPINGTASKTKIARKSSWVEVLVPLAPALVPGGYDSNPFPVIYDGSQPLAWSLPRVNLKQQRAIPVPGKFDWLHGFAGLTLSASEQEQTDLIEQRTTVSPMLELKASLRILFVSFVGLNHQSNGVPARNFQLHASHKDGDVDTLILATALRHDRDAGSVVLDAYVIPLTDEKCAKLLPALQRFTNSQPLGVTISKAESILWKCLLPALAERCRYTWMHTPSSCEYRAQGQIPLSTAHGETPLCSCGEGQALDGFPKTAGFKPFAKHATRIAIPLLFPVPYVEPLLSKDLERELGMARLDLNQQQPSSPPSASTRMENKKKSPATSTRTSSCCSRCGAKPGEHLLKTCARCGQVWYCGRECQTADWKVHKLVCKKP